MPRRSGGGINGHEPHFEGKTNVWLTPRWIIDALGPFDLDPCAADPRPWDIGRVNYTVHENGLAQPWQGFVFCNPPYGPHVGKWLRRCADHGNGIALVFARTETNPMQAALQLADAALFLRGRLSFLLPGGGEGKSTGGGPSMLLGFGDEAVKRIGRSQIPGVFFEAYGRSVIAGPNESLPLGAA